MYNEQINNYLPLLFGNWSVYWRKFSFSCNLNISALGKPWSFKNSTISSMLIWSSLLVDGKLISSLQFVSNADDTVADWVTLVLLATVLDLHIVRWDLRLEYVRLLCPDIRLLGRACTNDDAVTGVVEVVGGKQEVYIKNFVCWNIT